MRRMVLAALLMAASGIAQQMEKPSQEERVSKMVPVKYVDPVMLAGPMGMFGVSVTPNRELKVIALNGTRERVAAAEEAIHKLDVPAKNLELVVYFVVGSDASNLTGPQVPAEVRDVITQLKNTFTFKEYRMLDTLTLRARAGTSAETSGVLDPPGTGAPRFSTFGFRSATVNDEGGVRIERLHAAVRIPVHGANKVDYMNSGIDQDVDVKAGQKVVVGRASLEGPGKALFLILTAKVAE